MYLGTFGEETVTRYLSESAQDLFFRKGHGTSTVARRHQSEKLEQKALGQR